MLKNWLNVVLGVVMRQKLTVFSATAVILLFWLLLNHTLEKGKLRSLGEQNTRNGSLLYAVEDSVIRSFQSVNVALKTVVEHIENEHHTHETDDLIFEQLRVLPQIRALIQFDLDGKVLSSTVGEKGMQLSPACLTPLIQSAEKEYAITQLESGRFPGDLYADQVAHRHIPFCAPVHNKQGDLDSVLMAVINPSYFTNMFEAVRKESSSSLSLYLYDGSYLIGAQINLASTLLLNHLQQKSWGSFRVNTSSPESALISYRSTSLLPLIVVATSKDADALKGWRRDERMIVAVLLLLSFCISLVAGFIVVVLERRNRIADDNKLLSAALRSAANAVFITNRQGKISWVNEAFVRLTGYKLKEVEGRTPKVLNSGLHDKTFFHHFWSNILSGKSWRGELRNLHKDGCMMTVDQTVTPILDSDGEITHFVAVHEDITARKYAEERVTYLADHDSLTGLPNRRHFDRQLQHAFERNEDELIAILFIDLDRFKEINDTLGHEAGDVLLSRTSHSLKLLCADDSYLLARLGGDEFAIIMSSVSGQAQLSKFAEKLIDTVSIPFEFADSRFSVTCSVGVAYGYISHADASMLQRQADMAMYRAKHEGKNTYRFFDEAMDQMMKRRVYLHQQLDQALKEQGAFSLRYQPQISAITGDIVGAEALMRWQVSNGEWVSPVEFVRLAEETGLILGIGNWLMEKMFSQMARWNRHGVRFQRIAMNISAVQLARDNLADRLLNLMSQFDIGANQLSIEITETTLMAKSELVYHNLKTLKAAGLTIMIDDFGTGYSSLSYLKEIDADCLKIDRSFVSGIGDDHSDESIIQATVALAHRLHLKVVAEGVETQSQEIFLQGVGCDVLQGYRYAKPLTTVEFESFLTKYKLDNKPAFQA